MKIKNELTIWQIFILLLSIYTITAIFIDVVIQLPKQLSLILQYLDTAICFIFIGDFFIGLYRAKNRLQFLKWGWIDLISSIPYVGALRFGRIMRIVKILRLLRGIRSLKHLLAYLLNNKARGTFASVSLASVSIIIFSTLAILQFEDKPECNIKNAEDAVWWAFVTFATVGYGDKYPVTTGGRILGILLMTTGIGLFGAFTAYVAAWFIRDEKENNPLNIELSLLHDKIDRIEAILKQQDTKVE
jgi:voltage-gated potassium channel